MLFNFELEPLSNVVPWGESNSLSLSWFGLTDGQYWIQAGDHSLLEYCEGLTEQWGGKRYCDYYVARLYEDLMEMLPYILEPVPELLQPYISGETARVWKEANDYWWKNSDELDEESFLDISDAASSWTENRSLDTAYLSPGSKITIWSDDSTVYIEWDNRNEMIDGKPAWTAQFGSYELSKNSFVSEVRSFHERFMDAMTHRVENISSETFPPDVSIDIESVRSENEIRSRPIDRSLNQLELPTNWEMVYTSIREIENSVLTKIKD